MLQYDCMQEDFFFTSESQSLKFNAHEITEITQYNARSGGIPWSDIYLWEIHLKNNSIIKMTSIIITASSFRSIFSKSTIKEKHNFFVSL